MARAEPQLVGGVATDEAIGAVGDSDREAWLLDRRQWWAAAIHLVHVWLLLGVVPNWTYALAFHATLIGVIVVGWRERATPEPAGDRAPAPDLLATPGHAT